jgi:hypothetical protein
MRKLTLVLFAGFTIWGGFCVCVCVILVIHLTNSRVTFALVFGVNTLLVPIGRQSKCSNSQRHQGQNQTRGRPCSQQKLIITKMRGPKRKYVSPAGTIKQEPQMQRYYALLHDQ